MTVSHRVRQAAAILVVVFVLVGVWAAYGTYAAIHPPGSSSSGPVLVTYSENSSSGFAAALSPSYLYNNSTEIFGGNITLFTPITKWINVTILSTLTANRTVAMSLHEVFSVILSTAAWSKPLFTSENTTSLTAGTGVAFETLYDVNVSRVLALGALIDSQLGYLSGYYTLTLDPFFWGSITIPGQQQPVSFDPRVNFTFAASMISPSGLTYVVPGMMVGAASSSDTGGPAAIVAYLVLAGAIVGAIGSAWLASRREAEEEALPPFEKMVEPYEEAIATTNAVPRGIRATEVGAFADLVKIADTLGRPILRPADGRGRPRLYVVDGETVYRYTYPGGSSRTESAGGALLIPPRIGKQPLSPNASRLLRELRKEVRRFRGLSLDDRTSLEAVQRARRAAELLNTGREAEAEAEIVELARLLSRAVEVPARLSAQ